MTVAALLAAEPVEGFPRQVLAWTTTRADGSFGMTSDEPIGLVMARWTTLQESLAALGISRLACASQVHGADVVRHGSGWQGWLRLRDVDGHVTTTPGTALAVTIADCTPVLIAHPAGAIAALHAGWRGTAAGILHAGLDALESMGFSTSECTVHLGPAICGPCYEVGPEVLTAVHGYPFSGKSTLDVRSVLKAQAEKRGVAAVTASPGCTKCHPDRYFSHRNGDAGRQLAVIALQSS